MQFFSVEPYVTTAISHHSRRVSSVEPLGRSINLRVRLATPFCGTRVSDLSNPSLQQKGYDTWIRA